MPAYLDQEFFDEVEDELGAAEGIVFVEYLDGPVG